MVLERLVARALALCCAVGIAAWGTPARAQERLDGEFQVNTYTSAGQERPSVAADADGNFVVVWDSDFDQDGNGLGVFARRYAADGTPLGGEIPVNSYTTGDQASPVVAMDADGAFVVVWNSFDQDGSVGGIFGRRFGSDGSPLGNEFQLNVYTTASQSNAAIAMDTDGDFVVVWQSDSQDGDSLGIYVRRYTGAAVPLGNEYRVNVYTTAHQRNPAVAVDSVGSFVVAWQNDAPQDGDTRGIFARRYDVNGNPVGGEIPVNVYTTSNQLEPAVGMDGAGNFVVAWASQGQDGSPSSIFGRRYGSDGSPLGGEFPVNAQTSQAQVRPSIAMARFDGEFVVAWQGEEVDDNGVFGRRFVGNGDALGGDFHVNTYTLGNQAMSAVAMDARARRFVVVWQSPGAQDGSSWSIRGQRYRFGELDFYIAGDEAADPIPDTGARR